MSEEADEMERIAKKADKNADIIDKAKKKLEGMTFAEKNLLDKTLDAQSVGDAGGMSREQMAELMIDVLKELETAKTQRTELSDEAKEAKAERDEIKERQKEEAALIKKNEREIKEEKKRKREELMKVREKEGEFNEMHNVISGMKNNPIGFVQGKAMGSFTKLGIYGLIAQFAIDTAQSMYGEILAEVKKGFEEGGVFDIRKDVLNEMKHVANIEHILAVHRGEVFFTNDTSELLRQGVPQTSNTREKVNGHKQYLQEFDR